MKLTATVPALILWTLFALSPAHAADAAASAPRGAAAEACRQDVQNLCNGVQPGEGRVMACLHANRDKLSEGCKAALKAQHRHRRAPVVPAGT